MITYGLIALCILNTLVIAYCTYSETGNINVAASALLFAAVVNGLATAYTLHVKKVNDDLLEDKHNDYR